MRLESLPAHKVPTLPVIRSDALYWDVGGRPDVCLIEVIGVRIPLLSCQVFLSAITRSKVGHQNDPWNFPGWPALCLIQTGDLAPTHQISTTAIRSDVGDLIDPLTFRADPLCASWRRRILMSPPSINSVGGSVQKLSTKLALRDFRSAAVFNLIAGTTFKYTVCGCLLSRVIYWGITHSITAVLLTMHEHSYSLSL